MKPKLLFKFNSDLLTGESDHIACWDNKSAEIIIEDGWGKLRLTTKRRHSESPWEETLTFRSYAYVYNYSGDNLTPATFEAFKTKAFVDEDWNILCVDRATAKLVLRERTKLMREFLNDCLDNIKDNLGL